MPLEFPRGGLRPGRLAAGIIAALIAAGAAPGAGAFEAVPITAAGKGLAGCARRRCPGQRVPGGRPRRQGPGDRAGERVLERRPPLGHPDPRGGPLHAMSPPRRWCTSPSPGRTTSWERTAGRSSSPRTRVGPSAIPRTSPPTRSMTALRVSPSIHRAPPSSSGRARRVESPPSSFSDRRSIRTVGPGDRPAVAVDRTGAVWVVIRPRGRAGRHPAGRLPDGDRSRWTRWAGAMVRPPWRGSMGRPAAVVYAAGGELRLARQGDGGFGPPVVLDTDIDAAAGIRCPAPGRREAGGRHVKDGEPRARGDRSTAP